MSCHEWTGRKHMAGYGVFSLDGKEVLAHRDAWEKANGPIPKGLQLHHKCGNKLCYNPDHLEAVTQKQNNMKPDGLTTIKIRQGKLAADIRKARGDYRTPNELRLEGNRVRASRYYYANRTKLLAEMKERYDEKKLSPTPLHPA